MAKQRLRITVPYPESSLNMGNPDTRSEFGWAGITQKTDKHFFIGVAEQGLFQAGGTVVFQTEDKWHQYAAEMAHATEGRLHLGSGEAMILFAGGGQGFDEAEAFGEDVAGSSPATNSYNKIDLMAAVQTQAAHVKKFLGTSTATGQLDTGFLKKAEELEIKLGHLDQAQSGDKTELAQITPEDSSVPLTKAEAILAALEKLEEKANELAGIESEHDMMARFNPYSGATGIADFGIDWARKMRGLLSDNALTKASSSLFEVGASSKNVRTEWDGMVQSGKVDAYAESVGTAARAQGAFDESEDETQATLQTSEGPWDLSGDGPYELLVESDSGEQASAGTITATSATTTSAEITSSAVYSGTLVIAVDGGAEKTIELNGHSGADALAAIQSSLGGDGTATILDAPPRIQLESGKRGTGAQIQIVSDGSSLFSPGATAGGGNVVDSSAVTAAEVKAALTMPAGSEVEGDGEGLLFRSQTQGEGSRIALSSGLAESLDAAGEDEITSDDLGDLDTMTARQGAVLGYLDPLIGAILDPVEHVVSVASSAVAVVNAVTDVGSALQRLARGGDDDNVPLALLASGGITLGTENRVYGTASKGFYFVADGGQGVLADNKMVPRMLKEYARAASFVNRSNEPEALPSLGFRVRSDSDVDLKADFFGALTAVDATGLVRIESGGATEITAVKSVAVGPRAVDSEMEVFGDQILVGVREPDKKGIGIKDHEFTRPDGSTQKAWPSTDKQKPTQDIALSAEKTVQIEAGDYLVEVGSEGVRIGWRKESAPATAAVPGVPATAAVAAVPATASTPAVAAVPAIPGTPGTPGKRAELTIDAALPMLKVHKDALTIVTETNRISLKIEADGTLTLLGKASSQMTLGDKLAEIGVDAVKMTATDQGMTINGGAKFDLKGDNVVQVRGGVIKLG
jgi:hypothetical protein